MKLSNLKRVLPCFFLTMVVLTAPAFAEFQSVRELCRRSANCLNYCLKTPDPLICGKFYFDCPKCGSSSTFVMPSKEKPHEFSEEQVISATCLDAGEIRKECTGCGAVDLEIIPALGHIWSEINRTEATSSAPGSIEYTCSACNETKTESIPQLPDTPVSGDSLTLTSLLQTMTEVFSTACQWIGAVSASVAAHPILLLGVVIGFIGAGAGLFRRLLNL